MTTAIQDLNPITTALELGRRNPEQPCPADAWKQLLATITDTSEHDADDLQAAYERGQNLGGAVLYRDGRRHCITDPLDIAEAIGSGEGAFAMLEVDWSTGIIEICTYAGCQRNETPMRAWHGHMNRWMLPSVDALAVAAMIEEIRDPVAQACEQYYSRWDGSNHIAGWRDLDQLREQDPELMSWDRANYAITTALSGLDGEPTFGYWDAQDWLSTDPPAVAATVTEEQLEELAEDLVLEAREAGQLVDPAEVRAYLRERRDEIAWRQCQCGEILGEQCQASDCDESDMVEIELVPVERRATVLVLGGDSVYSPAAKGQRITLRVHEDCATRLIDDHQDDVGGQAVRVTLDEENSAEQWWDGGGLELWTELVGGDYDEDCMSAAVWRDFVRHAEQIPGWATGPDYAQHPFVANWINPWVRLV
jgi:hypothetical protein